MAKNKKQNNAKAKNMKKVTDANAKNREITSENNIGFENDARNCK